MEVWFRWFSLNSLSRPNRPWKKSLNGLFSLLNMESPKVQKVSHWLSKDWFQCVCVCVFFWFFPPYFWGWWIIPPLPQGTFCIIWDRLTYIVSCKKPSSDLSSTGQKCQQVTWLVVSTHLKNISQIGNLPQIGVKIINVWNHHLVTFCSGKKNPALSGLGMRCKHTKLVKVTGWWSQDEHHLSHESKTRPWHEPWVILVG